MKMTKEEAFKMLQNKKVYAGEFTKDVQEKLFEIGFEWFGSKRKIQDYTLITIYDNGTLQASTTYGYFLQRKEQEITISQILGIELEDEFEDGDICYGSNGNCKMVFIYKSEKEPYRYYYHACIAIGDRSMLLLNDWCITNNDIRFATKEECDKLLNAIDKQGYKWNAEEKKLEKKRWRAEDNGFYYIISDDLSVNIIQEENDSADNIYYDIKNYFQSKEEAQQYADKIKELLKNR